MNIYCFVCLKLFYFRVRIFNLKEMNDQAVPNPSFQEQSHRTSDNAISRP